MASKRVWEPMFFAELVPIFDEKGPGLGEKSSVLDENAPELGRIPRDLATNCAKWSASGSKSPRNWQIAVMIAAKTAVELACPAPDGIWLLIKIVAPRPAAVGCACSRTFQSARMRCAHDGCAAIAADGSR